MGQVHYNTTFLELAQSSQVSFMLFAVGVPSGVATWHSGSLYADQCMVEVFQGRSGIGTPAGVNLEMRYWFLSMIWCLTSVLIKPVSWSTCLRNCYSILLFNSFILYPIMCLFTFLSAFAFLGNTQYRWYTSAVHANPATGIQWTLWQFQFW